MPRLSRVTIQRRHTVGGDEGDQSDENAKVVDSVFTRRMFSGFTVFESISFTAITIC
jgi:hypothetical protein